MKAVYLVNPSERNMLENAGDRMPLGLASIAAVLQTDHRIRTRIYDLNHVSVDRLVEDLKICQPEIVGISVFTPTYNQAQSLARLVRENSPTSRLVAGGYHPTALPQTMTEFDQIVIGEGENAIGEIINGEKKKLVISKSADLSKIPIPARYLLPREKYNLMQNGKRTATLLSSRGCPHNCVYCGNLIPNRRIRFKPIDKLRSEIKDLQDLGFEALYFCDDMFTLNRPNLKKKTDLLKKIGMPYRATTRADTLDTDKLERLADSGCEIISLGIESGSDRILRKCRKNMTTEQNRRAVRLCKDFGIQVKGFFIIGLPGETYSTAMQTIKFAKELKKLGLTSADFYPLVPFPGSDTFAHANRHGLRILHHNWDQYLQAGAGELLPVSRTRALSEVDIMGLVKEANQTWKS